MTIMTETTTLAGGVTTPCEWAAFRAACAGPRRPGEGVEAAYVRLLGVAREAADGRDCHEMAKRAARRAVGGHVPWIVEGGVAFCGVPVLDGETRE